MLAPLAITRSLFGWGRRQEAGLYIARPEISLTVDPRASCLAYFIRKDIQKQTSTIRHLSLI